MPILKLIKLGPHAWNKQREKGMTSEKFAKLQIETDICRLDLGRTEVRLPQIPVQKADLNKQLGSEKMGLFNGGGNMELNRR